MTNYNNFNIRNSVAAAICSVLFTVTCIVAVSAPVAAAQKAIATSAVNAHLA
jgi:hypothetical protein